MKKRILRFGLTYALAALVLCAGGSLVPEAAAQKKEKGSFGKAGGATETGMEKAGTGMKKGLEATGKGTGAAVEHTGRGATKAGKATGKAMKKTGKAIGGFFSGGDSDSGRSYEDRVRAAQRALQSQGYYGGAIDGIAGPKTRSGLREFQRDNGLEVTGKIDGKTAKKLGID